MWAQVASVAASGNDVTVNFKAPNVPFAGIVAKTPIVPEHLWSSVPDPTKFTNPKPVGTGPFTLDKFAPTQYSLKKNPSYWQAAKIAPTEVVFPAQASNQSTNQLDVTSGKFDWSYTFLPDVQKTYIARNSKQNAYWFPPGGVITLFLNLTKAPFSDVNFRKGISLSLDRTAIATKAVNGYMAAASQSGMILPNLKKWLDPSLPDEGVVKQDATAAQAAFAQAGYTTKGGKLIGKDGKQATMSIVMPGNFSDWVAAAKEVTNQLGKAGIKVTLDLPQYAQYSTAIQGGTFRRGHRRIRRYRRPVHRLQQHAEQQLRHAGEHADREQLRAVQGSDRRPGSGDIGRRHRRLGPDAGDVHAREGHVRAGAGRC